MTSKVIMEVIFVLFFVGKHIFRVTAAGDEASKKKGGKREKSTGVVTRQRGGHEQFFFAQRLLRLYLFFCASNASKSGTYRRGLLRLWRQYAFFCTSKASKSVVKYLFARVAEASPPPPPARLASVCGLKATSVRNLKPIAYAA